MTATRTRRQLGTELVSDVFALVADQLTSEQSWTIKNRPVSGDYPWAWQGVEYSRSDGCTVRIVTVDLELSACKVIVLDGHGVNLAEAEFNSMPAGVIAPIVVAYLI